MKVLKAVVIAAVLAVTVFAATARAAEDQPLFSLSRLTFAGGVNYAWHAAPAVDGTSPLPAHASEFEAGLYAAYNLTPKLSIPASSVYGFDNKLVETRVGLRIRFGRGE